MIWDGLEPSQYGPLTVSLDKYRLNRIGPPPLELNESYRHQLTYFSLEVFSILKDMACHAQRHAGIYKLVAPTNFTSGHQV